MPGQIARVVARWRLHHPGLTLLHGIALRLGRLGADIFGRVADPVGRFDGPLGQQEQRRAAGGDAGDGGEALERARHTAEPLVDHAERPVRARGA